MPGYFFAPGNMLLSLSMRLGLAIGVAGDGLAGPCTRFGVGANDGAIAGTAACGLALFSLAEDGLAAPGNGVLPSTTLAAENVGTVSLSFLTRMEILRFEGSVGLLLTRSIWSAYPRTWVTWSVRTPSCCSSRLAELARSADRSQLL